MTEVELLTHIAKDVHIILGVHLTVLVTGIVVFAVWFYDRMT